MKEEKTEQSPTSKKVYSVQARNLISEGVTSKRTNTQESTRYDLEKVKIVDFKHENIFIDDPMTLINNEEIDVSLDKMNELKLVVS